jgi:hypothetical protein
MTDQEVVVYIERLKKFIDGLIDKGPEACRIFLVENGFCYDDGSLHENYDGFYCYNTECEYHGDVTNACYNENAQFWNNCTGRVRGWK